MLVTVNLPKLAETAEQAVVVAWLCHEGQVIQSGDPLVTVETDKVNTDVPSPVSGTVVRLLARADQEVIVGTPLCQIEAG